MRKPALWVACACAVMASGGCSMRPKEPPPSTDIDDTTYSNAIGMLASDEFAGRKPGTAGEEKTVTYLIEQFKKLKLKPGNGESFVQQVPLVAIQPLDAALSTAGTRGSRELKIGQDVVVWIGTAVPQVRLEHSELVFLGYGIVAPEYSWNDYANVDVHGKTVVVLAGDPGFASKDPTVFRGNSMTGYGRWAYKLEEAGRQGADAILIVHDAAALGFGWNAVQSTWGGTHFVPAAADAVGGAAGSTAIEGWMQVSTARELFAAAGMNFSRMATAAAYPGFKAVALNMFLEGSIRNALRPFDSQNVVALWPGRKSHEYVLYVAHWDSLGAAAGAALPGGEPHDIFNGAVDDASGVAGLVALAQSFARTDPKPERSIVFLAATAAEPDLLGAAYYVKNPVFPLRQTAAVINVGMLLPGGRTRDISIMGFGNTDLEEMARAEALLQGRVTHAETEPQWGLYYRSDGYWFARRGVPVLYAQGGTDVASRGAAWGKAQVDDYFAHRFRQPSDQYSPDWDVSGAVVDLTLDYQVGLRVAMSRRFPRWYPNSEYRGSHRRGADIPGTEPADTAPAVPAAPADSPRPR